MTKIEMAKLHFQVEASTVAGTKTLRCGGSLTGELYGTGRGVILLFLP